MWPFKCEILTILTLAKCLQDLLRDSTLSIVSVIVGSLDNAENCL